MNRYTYKGKRKDNGEWVYGDLRHTRKSHFGKDDENILIISSITNSTDYYEIIPETLSQCTGIQDTECNYIFEYDIVKYLDYICTVKYKNGSFYLDAGNGIFFFYDMHNSMLKIIGNKFEVKECNTCEKISNEEEYERYLVE